MNVPRKSVIAIGAHPDDIEFTMAGTLLALAERGWEVHYMNISNGNGGSMVTGPEETGRIRTEEAKAACKLAGFIFHPPISEDLMIAHNKEHLAGVISAIRAANPSIVLTQSPSDYMEDHQNATRLAVTAAFAKGFKNAPCEPYLPPAPGNVVVYHGMPHGLRDGMGKRIRSGLWVDVEKHIETKKKLLACHASQKDWLDATQGINSYLQTLVDLAAAMGEMSGEYRYAEGWRRHNPLGYSSDLGFDPLQDALEGICAEDLRYSEWLDE